MPFKTVYNKFINVDAAQLQMGFGTGEGMPHDAFEPRLLSRTERLTGICLFGVDLMAWGIAAALVFYFVVNNSSSDYYLVPGPLIAMLSLYVINGYNRSTAFRSLEYFGEHFIAIVFATAYAMLVTYVLAAFNLYVKPSRAAIPLELAIFALISLAARRIIGAQIGAKHSHGFLLVLGEGKKAERFCKYCLELGINRNIELLLPSNESVTVKRFRIQSTGGGQGSIEPVESPSSGCIAVVLACDISKLHPEILHKLIRLHCSGVRVQTVEAFQEQHWHRINAHTVGPEWLFDNEFALSHGSVYSHIKRLGDILFSLFALVVLSPVFLLIACIVRLDSPGPAIFRQERVGRDGRLFSILKYRTMTENSGDIYTQKGDTRITRSGRWLRLFRLDELPQLWNVLVGEMSLIGPRAEWVKCAEIYEKEIPHYHIRHLVHPGITGWAQVKYRYGDSTEDALTKFEYDLYYIRHFSLEMDFQILIKTIHTVIGGKGR